ncbi:MULTISPECIES: hypothetical protein [unclassified Vibrio]|uniref:hypothetical protein n=1 Tax=unclassified Vibrio TaxID=2614977 RepID=UPI00159DF7B3|nr:MULTISPECIES: hypothetical protein [unclassified Vibrio]NVN80207.1 hypothetical protein [Vibrio sp. Scap16]QLE95973.1 hypothetical protein FLM53_23695 [Vibrio sp. Scap24]
MEPIKLAVTLPKDRIMRNIKRNLVTTLLLTTTSISLAHAQELVTFSAGTPAKAEEVNANFLYLEEKIEAANNSEDSTVSINCSDDSQALKNLLDSTYYPSPLTVTFSGNCTGPITINKDNLLLSGEDGSVISGAVETADDPELYALIILGKSNISFQNFNIASGMIDIDRNSYVKLSNVALPAPQILDGEVLDNIYINSSNLRIKQGSLDNLKLGAYHGSYIRFDKNLTGISQSIRLAGNSVLKNKLSPLNINDSLELYLNATFYGGELKAHSLEVADSSTLEAESILLSGFLALNANSSLSVGKIEAKAMECHAASFYLPGDFTLTGIDEEAGFASFEAYHGCNAEIEGSVNFDGLYGVEAWNSRANIGEHSAIDHYDL